MTTFARDLGPPLPAPALPRIVSGSGPGFLGVAARSSAPGLAPGAAPAAHPPRREPQVALAPGGVAQDSERGVLHDLALMATRAPSLHDCSPWEWHVDHQEFLLYADPERLPHPDVSARALHLSCGSTLHLLRKTVAGNGLRLVVDILPDPAEPLLVAHTRLAPGWGRGQAEPTVVPDVLLNHHGPMAERVVSDQVLADLVASTAGTTASAVPVTERTDHDLVERLLAQSAPRQQGRGLFGWSRRGGWTRHRDGSALLVLASMADGPASRVQVGEAMCAVWLAALRHGLVVRMHPEVVEDADTREVLRRDLVRGMAQPQLVLRVGHPA